MNLERKSDLEKLATIVELIAQNGSGRFHGQKLLFLAKFYPAEKLLAIFEDQFDGKITVVRAETYNAQRAITFERLKNLRSMTQPEVTHIRGALPSSLPFPDQKVANFTNFEPISPDELEVYSPINAQFIRRLPPNIENNPKVWIHSIPFCEN